MDISQILAQAMGGNAGSIRPFASPIFAANNIPGPVMAPGQQAPRAMPAPPPLMSPQQPSGPNPVSAGLGVLGSGLGKLLQPSPTRPPSAPGMNVSNSTDYIPSMMTSGGASITGMPMTANANLYPLQQPQFSQSPNMLHALLGGLGGFFGS